MNRTMKKKKSTIATAMGNWAPTITFLIGIAGAAYTAYHTLLVQPKVDQRARLDSELAGIRTVRADAQTKALGKTDQNMLLAIWQSQANQEAGYVFNAERDIRGFETTLNSEQWFVLAAAEFDEGRQDQAITYIEKSISTTSDPMARVGLLRTEADWYVRLRGVANYDVSIGVIDRALKDANNLPHPAADILTAQLYSQKALYAFQARRCNDFTASLNKFLQASRSLEKINVIDGSLRQGLETLINKGGNCPFDSSAFL
ncbi:Uncharacterised protein [Burkholderia pseudomallei]|nr:hypothetical protein DP58_966 [Burkholderia pseudomallei]AIV91550.1 hypothetical protein X995_165 [Burkholderia pseudomallei B03]AIV95080.1 hypothetical protein X996_120 [Burkholderia pseudomallei A79A]AJW92920.1 hypothetical protein BG92_2437 [Burkholderia pseudomallei 406e]AJX61849.1 hypothetical protein DP47_1349 [Burkholderia pseudomallei Pasteur 52237]KGS06382.1 hypothetical protein X977_3035 [Burkholderia pseudomallei MSHR7504]KGU65079.1 hypothetical protein Y037_1381 [Burkholderia p